MTDDNTIGVGDICTYSYDNDRSAQLNTKRKLIIYTPTRNGTVGIREVT